MKTWLLTLAIAGVLLGAGCGEGEDQDAFLNAPSATADQAATQAQIEGQGLEPGTNMAGDTGQDTSR